jgi:hypothetical protein
MRFYGGFNGDARYEDPDIAMTKLNGTDVASAIANITDIIVQKPKELLEHVQRAFEPQSCRIFQEPYQ